MLCACFAIWCCAADLVFGVIYGLGVCVGFFDWWWICLRCFFVEFVGFVICFWLKLKLWIVVLVVWLCLFG